MRCRGSVHSIARPHPSAGRRDGGCIAVKHGIARLVGDLEILEYG